MPKILKSFKLEKRHIETIQKKAKNCENKEGQGLRAILEEYEALNP